MRRNGRGMDASMEECFSLGLSLPSASVDPAPPATPAPPPVHTYAQGATKELYQLTAAMGQAMAMVAVLQQGGWATVKLHGGQTTEARILAKILFPLFEEARIYPISKAYTAHMLFIGRGFRRAAAEKMGLLQLLEGCASLNTVALTDAYLSVRDSGLAPHDEYDRFADTVEQTSQKMFMDWFDHHVGIAKASIQATLEGLVDPSAGYLDPDVGRMLNARVFAHTPPDTQRKNRATLHAIMLTPLGEQLRPLFLFVGPPPIKLVMSRMFDEEY